MENVSNFPGSPLSTSVAVKVPATPLIVHVPVTQLNTFRDGSRANSTQMTQVAAKLNDKEIKAVSDYIAGLR